MNSRIHLGGWLLTCLAGVMIHGDRAQAQPPAKPNLAASATPAESLKLPKGFQAELLYTVPKETQGSWVNLCVDPKGRLIVSDQYGALYRVTPQPIGTKGEPKIEKIPAEIGMAQGLTWAFDALYVVVNASGKSGLYKVSDSNGDDILDKVEMLRPFDGGGAEHGPHAVIPHPDGKRLTVVCGNQTKLTSLNSSRVPLHWGEDHLLPRLPDGNGFMKGVLAPGGAIYNVTPDGKNWELVSIGYRNQYDAAYRKDGSLFTYDADMEWDFNTPWYRPTRVCEVISGSDWGWRNGAGKYPTYYIDTLPPVVDIGPGSPTGVSFGYGAKFPAKYQEAFFICDWSYGKLYAVHLAPKGSGYGATFEEFVTGTPLPLTDLTVNPKDGALYFAIGGRKTQSGLYRVTYTGSESTAPVSANAAQDDLRALRLKIEAFHGKADPKAVETVWPYLSHDDRLIRSATRIALEWQEPGTWQAKALAESNTTAILALIRSLAPDPQHRTKAYPPLPSFEVARSILEVLTRQDFAKMSVEQRLEWLRVCQVFFVRMGDIPGVQELGKTVSAKLLPHYPTGQRYVDGLMCELLVYLKAPIAGTTLKMIAEAPTQEEQLEYVRSLRMLKTGWTPEERKQYFEWFVKAGGYKGGNSFQGFLRLIKADAVEALSAEEKVALKATLEAKPATTGFVAGPARPFVKKWTMSELAPVVEKGLKAGGRDYDRGRKLFGAANCFGCHRYDNEGGSAGPDLSGVAGRFNPRDLLESILDPSKEISDQYGAVEIDTLDGKKIAGRIVNLNGDNLMINTDMLNPNGIVSIKRNLIDVMKPSKISMMPTGLLDSLKEDEIVDLIAYLLSRGDRKSPFFAK